MALWAVRSDICKAWNDHDVQPEVLRHGNIALGVRHKILSLDFSTVFAHFRLTTRDARYRSQGRLSSWFVRLCVKSERFVTSGHQDQLQKLRLRAEIGDQKISRRMSLLTLATGLFVELAQQLEPRSSRRNSGSQPAKAPGAPSDLPNGGTTTPEPNLGTLLYLISLGVVATATVVVFFGLGFFLLAHPNEELIAGPSDRGVEVEPQRADFVSPPNKDAAPLCRSDSAGALGPAGTIPRNA